MKSLQIDSVCPIGEAGSEAGSPSHNYHRTQVNTCKLPVWEPQKLSISLQIKMSLVASTAWSQSTPSVTKSVAALRTMLGIQITHTDTCIQLEPFNHQMQSQRDISAPCTAKGKKQLLQYSPSWGKPYLRWDESPCPSSLSLSFPLSSAQGSPKWLVRCLICRQL